MQSLGGKVTIITGASSGIGAGIAEYFAKQGARLSLAGRKLDNLNEVAARSKLPERDVLTTIGDVSNSEDRSNLIKRTIDKFGRLDVLVNNAGILQVSLLEDVTEQHFDDLFNINLKSHVFLTKLAIPHLVKSKGNIVNISSAGSTMLCQTEGIYSMSKAAFDTYTKVLAAEIGPKGVRVNAVNPGYVPATNVFSRSNLSAGDDGEEDWAKAASLKRAGTPEEIAKVAAFLASDLASFVTGELLFTDGGLRLRN